MRSTRRRFALPAVALATALALAACGGGEPSDRAGSGEAAADAGTASEQPSEDATPDGANDEGSNVTVAGLRAVETAAAEAGGVPFAISRSDDWETWDVDVATGDGVVEVAVEATGRTVQGTEAEEDLDDAHREAVESAPVSLVEAIGTAIAEVRGDLDEAELSEATGYPWTVTIRTGDAAVDVDVARSSGTVVGIGDHQD